MRLTRFSYQNILKEFENDLSSAQFVSLSILGTDGLKHNPKNQMEYLLNRQDIMAFAPLQLGLTIGIPMQEKEKNTQKYLVKPYCFNVFPHSDCESYSRFQLNFKHMEYLRKEGFDINSIIYEGIPFKPISEFLNEEKIIDTACPISQPQSQVQAVALIYANSQFSGIEEWLNNTKDKPLDDPANRYEIDLEGVKQVMWKCLVSNLPIMFPKFTIETEYFHDEINVESALILRRTTKQLLEEKKQKQKLISNLRRLTEFFDNQKRCNRNFDSVLEYIYKIAENYNVALPDRKDTDLLKEFYIKTSSIELLLKQQSFWNWPKYINDISELLAKHIETIENDTLGFGKIAGLLIKYCHNSNKKVFIKSYSHLMLFYRAFIGELPISYQIFMKSANSLFRNCFIHMKTLEGGQSIGTYREVLQKAFQDGILNVDNKQNYIDLLSKNDVMYESLENAAWCVNEFDNNAKSNIIIPEKTPQDLYVVHDIDPLISKKRIMKRVYEKNRRSLAYYIDPIEDLIIFKEQKQDYIKSKLDLRDVSYKITSFEEYIKTIEAQNFKSSIAKIIGFATQNALPNNNK